MATPRGRATHCRMHSCRVGPISIMGEEQFHTAFFSFSNINSLGFRKLGEVQGSFTEAIYILTKVLKGHLAHREKVTLHYTRHMCMRIF